MDTPGMDVVVVVVHYVEFLMYIALPATLLFILSWNKIVHRNKISPANEQRFDNEEDNAL